MNTISCKSAIAHQEKRLEKTKDWTRTKVLEQSMTDEARQTIIYKEEKMLEMMKSSMPIERDDMETLMLAVEQMMKKQEDYFARRMDSDKRAAMALEERVRQLLVNYRRRGYVPENKVDGTRQQTLFS